MLGSPSDPAAQWTGAHKGPAFFAYSDNYLIDVKFGVIVDVEASRAIRQAEVGAAKTMIERTEKRFGIKPDRLAADTAYGTAPMLNWLVERGGYKRRRSSFVDLTRGGLHDRADMGSQKRKTSTEIFLLCSLWRAGIPARDLLSSLDQTWDRAINGDIY